VRLTLEVLEERSLLSTFTVTDLGDTGQGSGQEGDLRYCITQANTNAEHINQIVFQPGLAGTIRLTQGPLAITKELVLDGPGQDLLTVSGNGQSGVLDVTKSAAHMNTVDVADLTIAGGTGFNVDGQVYGGGIYSTFADLTLTRVTVSGNSIPGGGDGGGGGIYSSGNLTLVSSTVADNQVRGGGTYRKGGGIYNAAGTLTLVSSTVADNQVGSGVYTWGGGIYNAGTTTVRSSTLSGNGVGMFGQPAGGGIYNAAGSTVTISDSAVIDNTALSGGGVFNSAGGPLIVDHSTMSANGGGGIWSYGWVDLTDSTVAENTGEGGIAAIDFRIERSTISGNNGDGGVWPLGLPGSGVIEDSTISGNTGRLAGGILMGNSFGGLGSFVTLDHCTIVNNHGTNAGGILVDTYGSDHGYLIIGQTIVAGNDASNPSGGPDVNGLVEISRGGSFIGNGALSSGWGASDRVGTADAPLDPLLGPLQGNGGPTLTHAPLPGSPLLLDGPGDDSPDQRGSLRLANAPGAVAYNPATAFRVDAPAVVVPGQPFPLTVTAVDPWGNTASTYAGTVHFRSSDGNAQLPDDYTFGAADGGAHTFDAALQTPGLQTILIQDTNTASLAAALSLLVDDGSAPFADGWNHHCPQRIPEPQCPGKSPG
jgi:hypothetical protein